MLLVNNDPDTGSFAGDGIRLTGGNRSFYHYGNPRPDIRTGISDNCSYCHQNTSTAFTSAMVNAGYNSSIQNHTRSTFTPGCTSSVCHNSGWLHNSTLTRPALNSSNVSPFCQNFHPDKQKNITYPLTNTSAVDCTSCHQTGIPGLNAPIIPDPLKHSSNLSNGSIWGTYWTSNNASCNYCHGDTKHSITAFGTVSNLLNDPNNTRNGPLTTTTWCADCHYNDAVNSFYNGSLLTPIPPTITVDIGKSGWVNHSGYLTGGYKDSTCRLCHALNGTYSATSLNYSHSLDPGIAGGPNCLECHNLNSPNAPAHINFTAANESVHFGMNSINATSQGYAAVIGSCWACHSSTGLVTSGHPDRYKTPKTCTECHLGTGTNNESAYNALVVTQHFYSGNSIKAGNSSSNISSCITCHENVPEMLLVNNDPDTGSFIGDGIRLTGGNRSFYHYGNPRPDIRTGISDNCSYCHQNTSTAFTSAMVNAGYNSSIQNHARSTFTPGCTSSVCHNSGWLHNSTLTRPALNSSNVSPFCQNCHPDKQKHNNTVDCSTCHINRTSQDTIHPIKYLQKNITYSLTNTSAVDCTSCHQTGDRKST